MSHHKPGSTKAEEAVQSTMAPVQEAVPSYGAHMADDLYTDVIPSYGSGLPTMDDELEVPPARFPETSSVEPFLEPPHEQSPRAMSPLPPAAPAGPLSLTLDKALIFPNTIPATALYSLDYTLNSMGNSITLRRSVPGVVRANGQRGKTIDKDLYDIKRPPFDLFSFSIHGKRKSTYPGEGTLRLRSRFIAGYWECRFKNKVVLKEKKGEWSDAGGKLIAREDNEALAKKGKGKGIQTDDAVRENPGLHFVEEGGATNDLLVDLLVVCWCAKTWYGETLEAKVKAAFDVRAHVKSGHALKVAK